MLAVLTLLVVMSRGFELYIDSHIEFAECFFCNDVQVSNHQTSCRLWVKNGINPPISKQGDDLSDSNGDSTFDFGEQDVDLDESTYLWTTCSDAFLIDYMTINGLRGEDYVERQYGSDNSYAWCISTDWYDAAEWNWEFWWTGLDIIPEWWCARMLELNPNGNVGMYSTAYNRRALNEDPNAPPSTADVIACEEDPETTESDCDALVDQIFNYNIAHTDNWHMAPRFPAAPIGHRVETAESNSDAGENVENSNSDAGENVENSNSDSGENVENSNSNGVDNGIRRRLFDLLQKFQ